MYSDLENWYRNLRKTDRDDTIYCIRKNADGSVPKDLHDIINQEHADLREDIIESLHKKLRKVAGLPEEGIIPLSDKAVDDMTRVVNGMPGNSIMVDNCSSKTLRKMEYTFARTVY